MAEQLVSLGAALLILFAYGAHQVGKLKSNSSLYLWFNFFGGGILAITAFRIRQLGLTVVETAWMLISLVALIKKIHHKVTKQE